ncbi:hypothetical protein P10VF_157 [Rhizobium phage vB_RleM_P10VF]|uniref:Glycosyltransferase n=1 Tax=Rhizobium phage vB_RleM_P10VF TaxID=1527770 RepID=A0A076YLX5_9CAUD|nr:hypothetical protein P10VF_157 [Rhizobium phage vB_RleM_P10VF]AIK68370.1 hypothetical protein P10VF_157 [Rhizobium phage vB_RleM_P10VF]
MRVLILNSFYYPLYANKGTNGTSRFCVNQHRVMKHFGHDVMHVTCEGSDLVYPGEQAILKGRVDIMDESRKAKSDVTRKMALEIMRIHNEFKPDVVLDSCNKRIITTFASKITTPYVFMSHNPTPIGTGDMTSTKEMFDRLGILHVGVSHWQNKKYGHVFDDVMKVHLAEGEFCVPEIKEHENYAVYISRWDKYKAPWIIINKFLKHIDMPLHFFTTLDGNDLTGTDKVLEKLQANSQVTFHVDADRSVMLDHVSRARVFLGNPYESAGIVALEANQNGIPYFVHVQNDKPLAQEEYLVPRGMKKSVGENYYSDFIKLIIDNHDFDVRESLAQSTREAYDVNAFYADQMRVIEKAKTQRHNALHQELDLF